MITYLLFRIELPFVRLCSHFIFLYKAYVFASIRQFSVDYLELSQKSSIFVPEGTRLGCIRQRVNSLRSLARALHPKKLMERRLYIIAGCNGAGKTTASYTILPEIFQCKEFVNADEIARGLSPFNPENVAIEAGRLMLSRIEELLRRGDSFSIETTLATKSYVNLVHRAQKAGYRVHLIFFWLESPELAMQRVAERVRNGGHGIPTATIKRRYAAGIRNLLRLYIPIVDTWSIYDNSNTPREQVAYGIGNEVCHILNNKTFKILEGYVK